MNTSQAYQVYTAYDCQAICATQSICTNFVFDKVSYICYIKGFAYSRYNAAVTSGPKICTSGFKYQVTLLI